jgi:hypothetical protein
MCVRERDSANHKLACINPMPPSTVDRHLPRTIDRLFVPTASRKVWSPAPSSLLSSATWTCTSVSGKRAPTAMMSGAWSSTLRLGRKRPKSLAEEERMPGRGVTAEGRTVARYGCGTQLHADDTSSTSPNTRNILSVLICCRYTHPTDARKLVGSPRIRILS